MKQIIQRIPMNVRRMNFFSFCDRCNTTHPFYSFAMLYRLSSRNHFHPRAQRALRALHLLKQCPTPTANRGSGTRTAQAIIIEVAPPRPQTEVDTCAAQAIIIEVAHPDRKPRQRHVHSAGYYYSSSPTPISNRGSSTCAALAII